MCSRIREPWLLVAVLTLATSFMVFAWTGDAQANLFVIIDARTSSDATTMVDNLRVFIDGRFRGVTESVRPIDLAVTPGHHRVELKFSNGTSAGMVEFDASTPSTLARFVVAVSEKSDPTTLLQERSDSRFRERCAGDWQADLGSRSRPARLSIHEIINGSCGSADAGSLGTGRLESCVFDGEDLLLMEFRAARSGRRYVLRFECRDQGNLDVSSARARGTLSRRAPP